MRARLFAFDAVADFSDVFAGNDSLFADCGGGKSNSPALAGTVFKNETVKFVVLVYDIRRLILMFRVRKSVIAILVRNLFESAP